ncbi:MAG: zf-HC2 domain-containing protein [Longimicrobiales bacterium]
MHAWMERLSEYLDGGLSGEEAAALEDHLEACAECRAALRGLDAVRERAARLEPAAPARDLWPGIMARLHPRAAESGAQARRRRTFVLTVPQLAATALVLASTGALAAWLAVGQTGRAPAFTAGASAGVGAATLASLPSAPAALGLERAVAELQVAVREGRDELDPETVRVLERNLAIIDAAIADIRAALEQDPTSLYLNRTLATALRRKLDVLTAAATAAAI